MRQHTTTSRSNDSTSNNNDDDDSGSGADLRGMGPSWRPPQACPPAEMASRRQIHRHLIIVVTGGGGGGRSVVHRHRPRRIGNGPGAAAGTGGPKRGNDAESIAAIKTVYPDAIQL